MGDPRAFLILRDLSTARTSPHRAAAISALGFLDGKDAVYLLDSLSSGTDRVAGVAAVAALAKMPDSNITSILLQQLSRAQASASGSAAVVSALGARRRTSTTVALFEHILRSGRASRLTDAAIQALALCSANSTEAILLRRSRGLDHSGFLARAKSIAAEAQNDSSVLALRTRYESEGDTAYRDPSFAAAQILLNMHSYHDSLTNALCDAAAGTVSPAAPLQSP